MLPNNHNNSDTEGNIQEEEVDSADEDKQNRNYNVSYV